MKYTKKAKLLAAAATALTMMVSASPLNVAAHNGTHTPNEYVVFQQKQVLFNQFGDLLKEKYNGTLTFEDQMENAETPEEMAGVITNLMSYIQTEYITPSSELNTFLASNTELKNVYNPYLYTIEETLSMLSETKALILENMTQDEFDSQVGDHMDAIEEHLEMFVTALNNYIVNNHVTLPASLKTALQDDMIYVEHTVKKGETLYSIAKKYGITVDELKETNEIDGVIGIGDVLYVPDSILHHIKASGSVYTVVKGDTLSKIAKTFNMTVTELKTLNKLTSNTVQIGKVLNVVYHTAPVVTPDPTPSNPVPTGTTYSVKKGDTLYSISKQKGVSVETLKQLNHLTSNTLKVGQTLILSTTSTPAGTYTVKKGDTLYSIAKNNNTTVAKLKTLNALKSDAVKIGQVLKVK